MTAPSPSDPEAVRAWVRAQLGHAQTGSLRAALLQAWADAYVYGGVSSRLWTPSIVFGGVDPSEWVAGNKGAADLLDEGGWAQLLQAADITVKSIADTSMDRVGTLLAEGAAGGDSVDSIANDIRDYLTSPARAQMIATTELARATELASMDSYGASGVTEWDWLLSPGACKACEEQAARNPRKLGDPPPPLHPLCRCASAPRGV